jgi:putative flavoprotein involved in K+ transport
MSGPPDQNRWSDPENHRANRTCPAHADNRSGSTHSLTTLEPDVIIAGTGFRTGISKLVQVPGITDENDRSVISGDQEFKDAPRLYFIGQVNPLSGLLREIRLEAGRIAKKIKQQLAAGR